MLLDPTVCAWFAAHHGVAHRDDLLRLGVRRHQIDHLVASKVLVGYADSVYRMAAVPRSFDQAAALACATSPEVVVCRSSAARYWGLRKLRLDRRVHVLVPDATTPVIPGVVLHRCRAIDDIDVVQRDDGIRLTSPPRTAFDGAAILNDADLMSVIEQLLDEELCTLPTLFAVLQRLRARGRAGSARFARVLCSRPAWLRPVDSDLELRFERAVLAHGLPRPLRQHRFDFGDGTSITTDFFWPLPREVVEIDHLTWHGGAREQAEDKRRDRQLWMRHRVHTTRITDLQLAQDLDGVLDDLAVILAFDAA